jgi:integrase
MRKPTGTRQHIRLLPNHRRTSGLFLRNGQYIADIKPDDAKRVIRKLGADFERAAARFEELVAELEDVADAADNPRVADFLLSTFLPTQRRLKSYAFSEKSVRGVVRFIEDGEPELRIRDVGPHHVERLRAFYSEQDYAPRTINMFTQKLKQALNHAADLGLLDANPIARVKQLTVDNRRVKFLALADFVRLLDAGRGTDARHLFLAMGLTGLRPSNVRLLTAGEVCDDLIRIPPDKMKNGRWGIVPVSTFARDVLNECAARPLYFPARGTSDRPKSIDNLSRSYRSLVRRIDGLEWSTLYDLRHFFASQLAKHGATEQQIARLLCHAGQSVTSRYVHHDIDDLRPFVEDHGERMRAALGGLPALTSDEGDAAIRV